MKRKQAKLKIKLLQQMWENTDRSRNFLSYKASEGASNLTEEPIKIFLNFFKPPIDKKYILLWIVGYNALYKELNSRSPINFYKLLNKENKNESLIT